MLKRVYEEPSPDDGYRVLVDRLWPRGVRKDELDYDEWAKDVAPSADLRRAWHHGEITDSAFRQEYAAQLDGNPGVAALAERARRGRVTLLFAAKDTARSHAHVLKAAIEAAGLRLRPILMTSFAFIIGCLPLAVASGAGAAARNGMGVAVVGGMLFATILGVFLIPVFYVIVEWIAAKLGMLKQAKKKTPVDYM